MPGPDPMRQNAPNIALFVLLAAGISAGWWYVDKTFFPKPERKPPPPSRETLLAMAGSAIAPTLPAREWPQLTRPEPFTQPDVPKPAVSAPSAPTEPPTLIALGTDAFYNKVLLTTHGGGVQQVTLTRFEEANRLGREVKKPDGSPQPLRLIPGVIRPRDKSSMTIEAPFPDLVPGTVTDTDLRAKLSEPSYLVLHYPSRDDPMRDADDAGRMNDSYPSPELGTRNWKVIETHHPTDGTDQRVVFETELGAPYFLKLRKTFTLGPKDYHVGLKLDIEPLPGRTKDTGIFRYQVVGARGLPIEGEWYTYQYRNVMSGWLTPKEAAKRSFEDALTIQTKHGGDKVTRSDNTFTYAAVATQYFASALAIDNTQPEAVRKGLWESVRPTREPAPWDDPSQLFLADVTVRAMAAPVNPAPNEPLSHLYLIYNGPVKVGLLRQMTNDRQHPDWEVSDELVNRYFDTLTLRTMSDYHSPNFFGRLANAIWWADLVQFFTNLMHSVLGFLHRIVPVWGLDVILMTMMVRLMLFVPSRRQQASMAKMQEQMARLKPELDKLHEKYKDDYNGFNQARTKLMMENGVNPLSTMGGCVLLFAQMPVLMGLYFCLQESVFFRLDPFLWVPNLAAPDMLIWWTEKIPFISTPSSLGSPIYLGPYLNILPLLSVALIFLQQKLTLPPPTDEQQEMQQKMMKMMVLMMAVFFYKVPAGLCVYFICGTLWALAERQFIPKPGTGTAKPTSTPATGGAPTTAKPNEKTPVAPAGGGGFLGRMKAKMEELQRQAEEQSKRQIRNAPPPDGGKDRKNGKKKRK